MSDAINDNAPDNFDIRLMPDGDLWLVWEDRPMPLHLPLGRPEHVFQKFADAMTAYSFKPL